LLQEAAGADMAGLAAMRLRHEAGEPAPYLAGFFTFCGHRFLIDRRAYITDPELVHLLKAVEDEGSRIEAASGRAPRLLEFGIGAGTLSITLKLAHPDWEFHGIDIDPLALEVAVENARLHRVSLHLLQSDFFSAWPRGAAAPDLIFGDPPWGGPEDLYDKTRDAAYYEKMPKLSAFPGGDNPCAIHDRLILEASALGWPSELVLNFGVLPLPLIERSAAPLASWRLLNPGASLSILLGKLRGL
jgi:methylase of polypeptide subunit release factors